MSRFTAPPAQTPDVWFAEAAAAGLQVELEVAAAAMRQLSKLPTPTLMAINCSPDTISHPQLRRLLAEVDPRRIVLELTRVLSRAHSISGGRKRPRRFPFSRAAGRVPERSDQQALRTH